jgi:hypothetical protein
MSGKAIISTVVTFLGLVSRLACAATVGFQPAVSYPVGLAPYGVAVGDFNADGKADLAVGNGADGTVSILLGNGNAKFDPAMNFTACQKCIRLIPGDFNADNRSDFAMLRYGDPNTGDNGDVAIFLSNGDGTFHNGQVLTPGKNPSSLIVEDVDADHNPDLIVSNATDVAILLGRGDGTFLSPVRSPTSTGWSSILLVDFDKDGLQDLAVVHFQFTDILFANGDGTFRNRPAYRHRFLFPNCCLGRFKPGRKCRLCCRWLRCSREMWDQGGARQWRRNVSERPVRFFIWYRSCFRGGLRRRRQTRHCRTFGRSPGTIRCDLGQWRWDFSGTGQVQR